MRHPTRQIYLAGILVLLLTVAIGFWGCSTSPENPVAPDHAQDASLFNLENPAVQAVVVVQERHTKRLMNDPDVIGTATTRLDDGRPAVMVMVTSRRAMEATPTELDGVPVRIVLTDPIVGFKGGPPGGGPPGGGGGGGNKVDHTAPQSFPIELGTSGGPVNDIANGYCCGGTLGSLISKGGQEYILSNSHVFAGDVVSGGNGRTSSLGDVISQPGLIDNFCQDPNSDVATVSSLSTLYPPNSTPNVDAAIAAVVPGAVSSSILEVGHISSSTVAASVGQKVKKSGRTSGLTRSTVDALNATVNVGYSTECAGSSFTKQFTGQIIIKNRGSKFLNSGDSGSLMIEDVNNTPRAVGLLYAGSSSLAVANPINDVLNHFNASMVP